MECRLQRRAHCNQSTNIDDHFHGNFPMFSLFIVQCTLSLGLHFMIELLLLYTYSLSIDIITIRSHLRLHALLIGT